MSVLHISLHATRAAFRTALRTQTRVVLLLSFTALVLGACGDDTSRGPDLVRGSAAVSEALVGTCVSACGGQSADGCYCDDVCESYGDCCDDFEAICLADETNACFDDTHCDDGYRCVAAETEGCCPPNALCSFDVAPCQGACEAIICPAFSPSCPAGEVVADTNGNGCLDGCVPTEIECFDDSVCPEDETCIALSTEGCCPPNALCSFDMPPCGGVCGEMVACPEYWPVCDIGYEAADTTGDGCVDGCIEIQPVFCEDDGDCENGYCEYFATCMGLGCPPAPPPMCIFPDCNDDSVMQCKQMQPNCSDDEVLAISNGCYACLDARSCEEPEPELEDGFCNTDEDCDDNQHCQSIQCITAPCPPGICEVDECQPILCDVGTTPDDTTGDGCFDTCSPIGCQTDADCDSGDVCTAVQCIMAPCPALCQPAPEPSCSASCGGEGDGCWCDEACSYYGDCCSDVEEMCF